MTTEEPVPDEDLNTIVDDTVPEGVQSLVSGAGPVLGIFLGVGIALLVALAITVVSSLAMKQIFRRSSEVKRAINRTRLPLFFALTLIGTRVTLRLAAGDAAWYSWLAFILFIVIVIGIAWWAMRVVGVVEAAVLARYTGENDIDDRRGRRLQTQVSLIRRILAAIIITVAFAAVLLNFESVRALGAGLLASAGVVSVVAGLAMQSTLTNVFAGIQLAFTDSIRVGDVVVVEDTFATVEDITLSAVVLKVWDERRVIYPSSYFVATPFENWTRVGTELMGTVELDVDWRVPMDELRGRLKRLLDSTELWDGKDYSMQVTEATGGMVKARVVVSARNSGELWDLRCLVREDLVNYLRAEHPYAVLTQRMLVSHEEALTGGPYQVRTGQFGTVEEPAESRIGDTREQPQVPAADSRDGARPGAAGGRRPSPEEQEFIRRYGSSAESAGHPSAAEESEAPGEGPAAAPASSETPLTQAGEGASVFTGSITAVERNREFSGPGEGAYRERRERQEEHDGGDEADEEESESQENAPRSREVGDD
ncbi:mechanosensitive ion channel domain-containing protein [Nesterenkonia xinjiangensis]|uniref:Small-conductance mechanosensitive channel n=1 Tax=Nesterenkonia xinjiangensis TaxID=225327 RepID=A0A7Z0GM29_9MICC|nr:mechanosensitive ion channel domain-containing protein [Nesterenkonia xinjiangensis]NYJ78497.1 small-conductance mechanosensitive channel [Nesterenkonia xinjiangensis]